MLTPLSQREVDIFFAAIGPLIEEIVGVAQDCTYFKVKSFVIEFNTNQIFKVCVDHPIDDPKFMISIPFEVNEVKNE